MDIGHKLQQLESRLKAVERSSRLSHASLDNTNIVVKDAVGAVRGRIGMQDDGTVGLIAQDGPAPGAPTAPIVTPSMGGLRIVWDGALADGSALSADFDHIAVHVSTSSGFTPSAVTFAGTITRSGNGGMLPVTPLPYAPHYVVFVAVNSSGIGGSPSTQTAATPLQVDGPDLAAGSVTAPIIHAGAVTADKLEAVLELVTRLVAGDPAGARVELNADGLRVYNSGGTAVIRFDSADGTAVFTGSITGSTVTGGTITGAVIQTAASGQRISLNESGANKILVYNSSGTVIGELSASGLIVKGTNGSVLSMDPNNTYPNFRLTNAAQTNSAVINVVEPITGDADLGLNSGTFTGSGFTDMKWRTFFGNDFWVAERVRGSSSTTNIGGRVFLSNDHATVAYQDTTNSATNTNLVVYSGYAQLSNGRLEIIPPVSSLSALYVAPPTGYIGNLLRMAIAGTDKFTVDKDGNTNVVGTLSAGNIATGTVGITPSAASTPTSATITYGPLTGTTFRGYATANTTVPGVRAPTGNAGVTGVSVSSVTSSSMVVWVNRENTTLTNINWQVIGS